MVKLDVTVGAHYLSCCLTPEKVSETLIMNVYVLLIILEDILFQALFTVAHL